MNEKLKLLSDEQLVDRFRDAAIQQGKLLHDPRGSNRLNDAIITPCYMTLAARGRSSAQKILDLITDENPNVRLNAAAFGFELDPSSCRPVLIKLIEDNNILSAFALGELLHKDAEFCTEFSRLAATSNTGDLMPLVRFFSKGEESS